MNDVDHIKDLVAEVRRLQDIINSQADRILDLESIVNELHHALDSGVRK